MKKQLLALSMVATSGLFAQNDAPMPNQSHNLNSNCDVCCCTPCCCRNPRPNIDCTCYTPPFHHLECDWGFYLDVEFLYWYARENNVPYAAKVISVSDGNEVEAPATRTIPTELVNIDSEWDPGVRVGLGWNRDCDGWDFYLNWTYYKNSSDECSRTPEFTGSSPQENLGDQAVLSNYTSIPFDENPYYSSVKGKWVNRFNQIDLVMGRKYWLSRCFVMRPFAGLRGAWTRTHLSIDAQDGPKDEQNQFKYSCVSSKDRIWGVGFVGGIEPTFYFTNCFALYANFGISAIWGKFEEKRHESILSGNPTVNQIGTVSNFGNSFSHDQFVMSTIIDTGIGLRWEQTWCCDRYRSALDLGWEHHNWRSHSFRYMSVDSTDGSSALSHYVYNVSDLGYGGFVLRVKWDF